MNRPASLLPTIALAGALSVSPSLAEDIDIYARPPSTAASANPNLLVILDNSASWNANNQGWQPQGTKQGEAELRALRTVAAELNDKVNLGLMMFLPTPVCSGCNDGAYVRYAVRQMTQTNKSALAELVGYSSSTCPTATNSLNSTPNCILQHFSGAEQSSASVDYNVALFEAFKYFGGYTNPANATIDPQVAGSPTDQTHYGPTRYAGPNVEYTDRFAFNPSTDPNLTTYAPVLGDGASCAKNFIVFIGNSFPSNPAGAANLLSGVGGDTSQVLLNDMVTSTGTSVTDTLETTACGEYASLAACQTAAATKYPGYISYSCELAMACPAGSATDNLGPSACGAYADQATCATGTATLFPAYSLTTPYTNHACGAGSSCSYQVNNNGAAVTPAAGTGCISDLLNNATNCTNYGNTNYPSYSGFSCSVVSNCSGGQKTWKLTATTRTVTGQTFPRTASRITAAASESYRMLGTRTAKTASATGTFSMPTSANTRYADEWARFLNRTDVSSLAGQQNITTFTINVFKDNPDPDQSALLMSMARAGGGKYFEAQSEEAIKSALRKIVSEIQAVNSVFASSSLPVSVNTQGTYLNQVFMGMFRPEGSTAPRWAGNLKQYEFKIFNGVLRLADMSGNEAISSSTGFITPCAASFWTSDTGKYWNFPTSQAIGDCTSITSAFPTAGSTSIFSDYPDGEVVEKGGAAQHLRGVISSNGSLTTSTQNYQVCGSGQTPSNAQCRKLLTCDGSSASSCTAFTSFDTANGNITATNLALPASLVGERDNLIKWIRGKDVDNENENFDASNNAITNEVRPSVHGGVVHSQPAVVDYGGTTGVVAFYGADDGVFHAVKGNKTAADGVELWGFIAPETYGRFFRLRDNGTVTAKISFPADSTPNPPATGTARKDYFFDGAVGIYQKSGTVWLFASMRRGGRAVYAFDVSDPANPVLKWRKGCFTNDTTNDTSCSTDAVFSTAWSGIGQTWSKPLVAYIRNYVSGGNPKPVLVFGGGYDTCEDADQKNPCGAGVRKGSQVWIVDAATGNIIRTYPTSASTPGDLSLLTDPSGYMTHIYISDINGDLYRVNVGTFNNTTLTSASSDASFVTAGWSSNATYGGIEIASLSETNHARKFLNGPNVVQYAGYNAVLIGSGDREHPLVDSYACNSYAQTHGGSPGTFVTNQFYMIKDRPNTYPASPITPADLTNVTSGGFAETDISANGWRFDFGPCELSVNKPLTVGGVTYFGTNAPSPDATTSCVANLGLAYGYAVDFLTGNAAKGNNRAAAYLGGGMPPSPVAGVVEVSGERIPFIIGGIDDTSTKASALQGSKVTIDPPAPRRRTFWYNTTD